MKERSKASSAMLLVILLHGLGMNLSSLCTHTLVEYLHPCCRCLAPLSLENLFAILIFKGQLICIFLYTISGSPSVPLSPLSRKLA